MIVKICQEQAAVVYVYTVNVKHPNTSSDGYTRVLFESMNAARGSKPSMIFTISSIVFIKAHQ